MEVSSSTTVGQVSRVRRYIFYYVAVLLDIALSDDFSDDTDLGRGKSVTKRLPTTPRPSRPGRQILNRWIKTIKL